MAEAGLQAPDIPASQPAQPDPKQQAQQPTQLTQPT